MERVCVASVDERGALSDESSAAAAWASCSTALRNWLNIRGVGRDLQSGKWVDGYEETMFAGAVCRSRFADQGFHVLKRPRLRSSDY